jgi:Flp pilus assembly protein TadG
MCRLFGRPGSSEKGIALVEFALTVPLFLVLLLGMLDYGYYFYVAVSATNAAREGARQCTLVALGACGACTPSDAVGYMSQLGLAGNTTANATCATPNGKIMYTVNVAVDYPSLTGYGTMLGIMPASSTDGNTMAYGKAVMRGQ